MAVNVEPSVIESYRDAWHLLREMAPNPAFQRTASGGRWTSTLAAMGHLYRIEKSQKR